MSRPIAHADLASYQRAGETLFSWTHELGQQPEVEQWLVKAKLEARKQGFEVGTNEVRIPKTLAQLDELLASAQSRWDNGEAQYAAVLAGNCYAADLGWQDKTDANFYANAEGLAAVESIVGVNR